jgi:hypothetical protein
LVTLVVECLLRAVAVDVKELYVAVACCCYKALVARYFQFVDLRLVGVRKVGAVPLVSERGETGAAAGMCL